MRDDWNLCYAGQYAREHTPETFRQTFCDVCLNAACKNSKGTGTQWARRMANQAELLLNNPNFANPDDPSFDAIRKMDFQSMLHKALAIHVSEQRGDWSVPTEQEIGQVAAGLVGMKPVGFKMPEEPEKLVGPDGKPLVAEEPEPLPEVVPTGQWRIKGSGTNIYDVTQWHDRWECSCPSREDPCKHILNVQGRLKRAPKVTQEEEPVRQAPTPPPTHPSDSAPPTLLVKAFNTNLPDGGLMIGGGPPPPPEPEPDPWAAPPKPIKTVPVGGRVRFGSGKRKKK